MRDLNKTILMGNLSSDTELRSTPSGTAVTTFRLATARPVKRNDKWETETEYHNIVTLGRNAEIAHEYLRKGSRILIIGEIRYQTWEDKETKQTRYKTEILVNPDGLSMLDRKERDAASPEGEEIAY